MENSKRLRYLFIALIFLAVVIYGRGAFDRYLAQSSNAVFKDTQPAEIDKLEIDGDKKQELYRKEKNWFVKNEKTEFRADMERVDALLKELTSFSRGDTVSVNKDKHGDFGIAKRAVTFYAKGKDHTIYIGNATGNGVYARLGSENEVFLADGLSDPFIPADYRDLTVPILSDKNNTDKVESVNINYGKISLFLKKEKDDWKIDGKPAKKDRVEFFLNDLATLKAADIKTDDKKLTGAEIVVGIKENGKERSASFYKVSDTDYLAILSGAEKTHYTVAASYVASMKKTAKDFTE